MSQNLSCHTVQKRFALIAALGLKHNLVEKASKNSTQKYLYQFLHTKVSNQFHENFRRKLQATRFSTKLLYFSVRTMNMW